MAKYWTIQINLNVSWLRAISKMLGEFFRDGGILVIVFGLLDKLNKEGNLPSNWLYGCISVGCISLVVGIILGLGGMKDDGNPQDPDGK